MKPTKTKEEKMYIRGTICGYKAKGESGYPEISIAILNKNDVVVPIMKRVVLTEENETNKNKK